MAWCLLRREPISAVTLPQARNCTIRRLAVGVSPAALTPHASCIARRCWPTAWCLPWEDLIAILTCPQAQNCTTLLHLRLLLQQHRESHPDRVRLHIRARRRRNPYSE